MDILSLCGDTIIEFFMIVKSSEISPPSDTKPLRGMNHIIKILCNKGQARCSSGFLET